MNCRDVNDFLNRGGTGPIPPDVRAHAESCEACSRLLEAMQQAGAGSAHLSTAATALPAGLLDDLKPVRPLPSGRMQTTIWLGAAAVVSALGVWMWGMTGWHAQTAWERLFVMGSPIAIALACAYGLTVLMVPGSARRISFAGIELAAFVAFAAAVLALFHREYPFPMPPVNLHCFERGLEISALAAIFLLMRMRRGVWFDRVSTALTAGAFVSAVALIVYAFYCPVLNFRHVFIAHVGAVAVVMAFSAFVGLLWRSRE